MPKKITLQPFETGHERALRKLFYECVHDTCNKDYSKGQLNAWAPLEYDETQWKRRLSSNRTTIANIEGVIAGFSVLQHNHVDCLFVSPDYQGKGVGHSLLAYAELVAQEHKYSCLTADVSLTAKDFFLEHGFEITRENRVQIGEEILTNFKMVKTKGIGYYFKSR